MTHMYEFNLSDCRLQFHRLTFCAKQSMALVECYPSIHLTLSSCVFEDGGVSFVEALESRASPIVSLFLQGNIPFNRDTLTRFLETGMIQHLSYPFLYDEHDSFLLTARVESLSHDFYPSSTLTADFLHDINIATKKLRRLIIDGFNDDQMLAENAMLSFWQRVAELGYFEQLDVEIHGYDRVPSDGAVQALIRAVKANTGLKVKELFAEGSLFGGAGGLATSFRGAL